ncbi:MAG TPA: glycosyl hydrolase family 65 protein, partial [Roseiflexaceae bacterium]|nr:glycosyl hydrolase family 65 protein [Roseiflexaceae bacterium]
QGLMGGAWAHPIRVLHGWSLELQQGDNTWPLVADSCDLFGSHVVRHYVTPVLELNWTEFVPDEYAALAGFVDIRNSGSQGFAGRLGIRAELDLRGCWFGGWAVPELHAETRDDVLIVTGAGQPFAQRAAALAAGTGAQWTVTGTTATASVDFTLAAGSAIRFPIALAVSHAGGPQEAMRLAFQVRDSHAALFEAKQAATARMLQSVSLATPDPALDAAWQVARLNLEALEAQYPDLPRYFLAGLPEYPQLFGCDCEYTTPGALAAGFGATMRSTLLALASYGERACGRIPHEITTNARVFHPGNSQETPQFAVACWDYFRWTGDMAFLEQIYPLFVEGLEHNRGTIEHGGYPLGDGVVERLGMGAAKLDSVCYLFQSLQALASMAGVLGLEADAARFASWAIELQTRFEKDWWLEREGMYADSLHLDGTPQFDGHWTVALPLQIGIASDERARRSLERIAREWVNEWGLVHTRGAEPNVWTLPTGLLALAAFRWGHPNLGLDLLRNIAVTAQHGTLGLLKELIPIGMCFVQLWSAGLLVQGLTEGLLGISPLAHRHAVAIDPALPDEWENVTLRGLQVGQHVIDLVIGQHSVAITHRSGPAPLSVQFRGATPLSVEPGQRVTLDSPA